MKKIIILCLVILAFFIPVGFSAHGTVLFAQEDDSTDSGQVAPDDKSDDESVDSDDESIDESELENVDPWLLEPNNQPETEKDKK